MKHKQVSAVHLFLLDKDEILLLKRQNTGFHDGDFSLPAGHIEENESVFDTAIREGLEELGLKIFREDLEIVQVMHRKSVASRIDFFLRLNRVNGSIINNEPHKSAGLFWYKLQKLPENTIPYIRTAINNYQKKICFDTFGW